MKKLALLLIVSSMVIWTCSAKQEHAGTEHAGQEHGGKAVSQEHAGQEHAGKEHGGKAMSKDQAGSEHAGQEHAGQEHGGQAAQSYTAAEIKGAMNAYIAMREETGIFKIHDEKTGENLELKFVKIHDPVRKIEGKGYFACTDFEVVGQSGKLYDLDFWLNPEDGSLKVTEEKIHKNPVAKGSGWEKKARYTFVNDNPVDID